MAQIKDMKQQMAVVGARRALPMLLHLPPHPSPVTIGEHVGVLRATCRRPRRISRPTWASASTAWSTRATSTTLTSLINNVNLCGPGIRMASSSRREISTSRKMARSDS